jgi:hypothetical protein
VHFWVWGWLEGKIFSGRGVLAFSGNKPYEGSFCRKEEQWGGNWNHQNSALNQNQGETPSDLHQKLFTPEKFSELKQFFEKSKITSRSTW